MFPSCWLSPREIATMAFAASDPQRFRERMRDELLHRAPWRLALCSELSRTLEPADVATLARVPADAVQRALDWLNAGASAWSKHERLPAVAVGPPRIPGADPSNAQLVLLWGTRAGSLVALMLGTVGSPVPDEVAEAALSTVCTIALADASTGNAAPRSTSVALEITARQRQILEFVGKGLTNAEVARLCGVSKFTIRNQLSRMFAQFDVTNRTELTQLFWENRDSTTTGG